MTEKKRVLFSEIKEYLQTEIDILKLDALEKSSRILSFVVGIVIASILSIVAIAYFSVMLFWLFQDMTNSNFWAIVIMILLFFALSLLTALFGERMFLNFFIKKIYHILFLSSHNNDLSENKQEEKSNEL